MSDVRAKWNVSVQTKGMLPSVKKHMKEIVMLTADAARHEWIKEAKKSLRSTATVYIQAIGEPTVKGIKAVIKLTGWLPNAMECGHEPYDMKPGLLKGPKSRTSKSGGRYNIVPFPMKTSGSRGASPPVMPEPIYRRALKMGFGESMALPKKYEGYAIRSRLSPDIKRWGNYTWKSSPFSGITKVRKWPGELPTTLAGRRAAYMTFRTVSSKSDPSSWIHPGFRAKNLMEAAADHLNQIFPDIVNKVVLGG